MSEKSDQDPQQDEQSPQTAEHDQLKTERAKLKTERAKQKTERAKLKTVRAKLKTERAKLNAEQGPQKSEQAPKKDNKSLFGLLEKTLMFLATLAVPVGACLWSDFFSMSSLERIVAVSFFLFRARDHNYWSLSWSDKDGFTRLTCLLTKRFHGAMV